MMMLAHFYHFACKPQVLLHWADMTNLEGIMSVLQPHSPSDMFSTAAPYTPPFDEPRQKEQTVSVSSSFFPGFRNSVCDIILRSTDIVLFYVNAQAMQRTSKHVFEEFLGFTLDEERLRDAIIDVPESSIVLNIIIHVLYGLSCAKHNPSFEHLETAINRMPVYGLSPDVYIVPSSPLFDLLLSHAPIYPIQIYALAGHFGIHELAVKTSAHLLSYDLADLTDDLSKRMGPIYLKRLMCLHLNIFDSLKAITLHPPKLHPETLACYRSEQMDLSRAWALAASYIAWNSKSDLSIHTLQSTFEALGNHITCDDCKAELHSRIKDVIVKWAIVKRTI